MSTIIQIANADRNLSLFTQGLKESGLDEKLAENGPFTIVGPVNLALGKLTSLTYKEMLEPAHKQELIAFLSGYILTGKKMLSDLRNNQTFPTIDGKMVTITIKNGDTLINGAKVLSRDRQGSNGVIHLLNETYSN